MHRLKDKMFNYEEEPPMGNWEAIASKLDTEEINVLPQKQKSNKKLYYTIAIAAAIALVVFITALWFNKANDNNSNQVAKNNPQIDTLHTNRNSVSKKQTNSLPSVKNNSTQIIVNNTTVKEPPISNTPEKEEQQIAEVIPAKKYITISGPEGQPVKISPKAASLIESSDDQYPPKPVWNKKIRKWKDIMQANTLAPSPGNFMDIVELSNTLKQR